MTVPITAAQQGLLVCETCGLLLRSAHPARPGHCPRCGEVLAFRRNHSIQISWALVIAAAICYLPANVFPVLVTRAFGPAEVKRVMAETYPDFVASVRILEKNGFALAGRAVRPGAIRYELRRSVFVRRSQQ